MSLFAQHGYGKANKIDRALQANDISGVILSPKAESLDKLIAFSADLHEKYPEFAEQLLREADVIFCLDFNEPKRVDKLAPALMAAIRMQADGFLSKRLTAKQFAEQLPRIAAGDMVISDALTNALAETLRNVSYVDEGRDISVLSPREVEVLHCIANGMSNRLISEHLAISDGTVKVHVKHLLKKLGFSTRVEAALWASENGHRVPIARQK